MKSVVEGRISGGCRLWGLNLLFVLRNASPSVSDRQSCCCCVALIHTQVEGSPRPKSIRPPDCASAGRMQQAGLGVTRPRPISHTGSLDRPLCLLGQSRRTVGVYDFRLRRWQFPGWAFPADSRISRRFTTGIRPQQAAELSLNFLKEQLPIRNAIMAVDLLENPVVLDLPGVDRILARYQTLALDRHHYRDPLLVGLPGAVSFGEGLKEDLTQLEKDMSFLEIQLRDVQGSVSTPSIQM